MQLRESEWHPKTVPQYLHVIVTALAAIHSAKSTKCMIYTGMNMEQMSYYLPVFCQVCGMRQKKHVLFNYLHVADSFLRS